MRCHTAFKYPATLKALSPRHCESTGRRQRVGAVCRPMTGSAPPDGEAIQRRKAGWIASSQVLLAMTGYYRRRSLSEPLDNLRRVHLIGLVVAGQGVHHDVDTGAERELALPRFTRRQWQHRLTVGSH